MDIDETTETYYLVEDTILLKYIYSLTGNVDVIVGNLFVFVFCIFFLIYQSLTTPQGYKKNKSETEIWD